MSFILCLASMRAMFEAIGRDQDIPGETMPKLADNIAKRVANDRASRGRVKSAFDMASAALHRCEMPDTASVRQALDVIEEMLEHCYKNESRH